MRLSSKGLDLIKEFEGLELKAYRCPANILTIGYGHTGSDVKEDLTITEEQANRYLMSDTESAQQCVSSFVVTKLNQNEYDALVSFTFNVGPTAFVNSTLLKLLNEGVTKVVVSAEFLRWVKAGGEEASPGLVRRREAERKLFLEKVKHPLLSKSILARQDTWLKREPLESSELQPEQKIPSSIVLAHLLFIGFVVYSAHYAALVVITFMFFLAFVAATERNQDVISLRGPVLVGFFLAGLVIHGGCQKWWIEPVLTSLNPVQLMLGATVLTAFNDNAAITYLASLVPGFTDQAKLAVVAGAVAGGGLTVIANAPNPAGQSILQSYFGTNGVDAFKLFLGALMPTVVCVILFLLLP